MKNLLIDIPYISKYDIQYIYQNKLIAKELWEDFKEPLIRWNSLFENRIIIKYFRV